MKSIPPIGPVFPLSLEDHLWSAMGKDVFQDFAASRMLPGLDEAVNAMKQRLHEAELKFHDNVLTIQRGTPRDLGDYELAIFQACRTSADVVVQEFATTMRFVYGSPTKAMPRLELAVQGAADRVLSDFFSRHVPEELGTDHSHYLELLVAQMKAAARIGQEGTTTVSGLPIVMNQDPRSAARDDCASIRTSWFDRQLEARAWLQSDFLAHSPIDPKTLRRFLGGERVRFQTRKRIAETFNSRLAGAKRIGPRNVPE